MTRTTLSRAKWIGCCALLLAAGCAPVLTQEAVGTLKPRETTDAQLREMFGNPKSQNGIAIDGGSVSHDQYTEVRGHGPFGGYGYAFLLVETRDAKLNGYIYCCDDGKTSTTLDESKANGLVKGKTSKDEVRTLLGQPSGLVLTPTLMPDVRPLVKNGTTEVWTYTTLERTGYGRTFQASIKSLLVAFDDTGRVQDFAVRRVSRSY